jgi:hypothetical protein
MVGLAGQVGAQLPRENWVTRHLGFDKASVSMRRHCVALLVCAEDACLGVQRSGFRGTGLQVRRGLVGQ